MTFRVPGSGTDPDRLIEVRRGFALAGRSEENDLRIDDQDVEARHVYLHLDPRGVYAVDLATRSGTRVGSRGRPAGWLRPGESFEVAGRRVELLRIRINGVAVDPPPSGDEPLDEVNPACRVGLTLEPAGGARPPWVLESELVFLGWSPACGVSVHDPAAARVHCALVRTPEAAYVVNLQGAHTRVNGRAVAHASALADGSILSIGSAGFTARVSPPAGRPAAAPAQPASGALVPFPEPPAPAAALSLADDLESAIFARVLSAVQEGQGEALRRQGELHAATTDLLRRMQQESTALWEAQLQRLETIDRELVDLRASLAHRLAPTPQPPAPHLEPPPGNGRPPRPDQGQDQAPPPPPLRPAPLRVSRTIPEANPSASASWLLDRVSTLENQGRSARKTRLDRRP